MPVPDEPSTEEPEPAVEETREELARRLRSYRGLTGYRWAMVLALRELDGKAHKNDLAARVAAILDLPPETRARPLPSGTGNYFEFDLNRTAQDLKAHEVIRYPSRDGSNDDLPRGYRELTALGMGITENELQRLFSGTGKGTPGHPTGLQPESPELAEAPAAWLIRASSPEHYDYNVAQGLAGISFSFTQDLSAFSSREDLDARGRSSLPADITGAAIPNAIGQLWRLRAEVQVGDLVVMPPKSSHQQMALGVVTRDYRYCKDPFASFRHVVSVDWKRTDVPRDALHQDLRHSLGSQMTICEIARHNAPWRLQQVMETGRDPGPSSGGATAADEVVQQADLAGLADELLIDVELLEDIVSLLEDKGQVILYGPPGTGKTYLAQALAEVLAPDEDCRALVQFHPSTSYEDFFEGYRPAGADDGGGIRYELAPGPLARMAERASEASDEMHVMIIDEINRGNLPRVLGELLFLLEYRDERVQTLYRHEEPFSLPENLWFIGTMNTADRSIALVDAALRRRFHFVPFFPDHGPMAGLLDRWLKREGEPLWIGRLVDAVNEELQAELDGSHLLLGPSHFMKEYGSSPDTQRERLRRIWEYNIEPFIEDQFFGDPDRIARFRFTAVMTRHGPPADAGSAAPAGSDEPTDPDRAPDPSESREVDSQPWRSRADNWPPAERAISDSTRTEQNSVIRRYVDFALQRGKDPGRRDEALVDAFLASLNLAASSERNYRSHLNQWFNHDHGPLGGGQ